MTCPRCGAVVDGNFCPRCGMPAPRPGPIAAAPGRVCPRCGTVFQGNFCPRCGLPAGTVVYPPPPIRRGPSSGTRSTLSVLWILALVGFFLFIAMNFAGLFLSPAYIVPGIQGISSGQNANQDLTGSAANWTFQALNSSASTGTYASYGGNPGGYLQMTLPTGSDVGGEWVQPVQILGSAPFAAEMHLDVRIEQPSVAPVTGAVVIALERLPQGINMADAAAVVWLNRSIAWTSIPNLDLGAAVGEPGTYYLKVAYIALSNGGATQVSFDNIHLDWDTDAVFYFYLPLPLPVLLFISQDKAPFLAYYAFIVAAIVVSAIWYTWRDRKLTVRAFTAPLDAIGTRLRSLSAWVAVAQVWLATTFFQVFLIFLLTAIGPEPTSPFIPTPENAWTLLFDYSAASVFEEIAFRAFLIGLPMAVGALVLRLYRGGRGNPPGAPVAPHPGVLGGLRYLWGGQLRRESSREAQLVAWILVFASATLFGLAHAPGWGWWKVLPAFVAGLGMAYVLVRHGLGASILLHFATDGSLALMLEGIGGNALTLVSDLMFLGLAIAGSGFLAWYVLYGWEEFQGLVRKFGTHVVRQPAAAAPGPGAPPPGWTYAPPTWTPGPAYPYPPAPPAAAPPPPPVYPQPAAQGWPPTNASPPPRSSAQLPQGYAPTYHPAPYGYPPVRFQCPYCGWVEAKYDARHFTCLRCGRTA